jgi:hypothetical protein
MLNNGFVVCGRARSVHDQSFDYQIATDVLEYTAAVQQQLQH